MVRSDASSDEFLYVVERKSTQANGTIKREECRLTLEPRILEESEYEAWDRFVAACLSAFRIVVSVQSAMTASD